MTMENAPSDGGLDWEALADALLGTDPGGSDPATVTDPASGGGAEDKPAEPSNEEPTTPARTFTEAEVRELIQSQNAEFIQNLTGNARAQAEQDRIKNLLANGTDEEVATAVRQAAQSEAERISRESLEKDASSRAVDAYAGELVDAIMTPEWIEGLTDEEAARINPAKFADDPSLFREITQLNAEKLAKAATETDIEARVAERVQAQQNAARGEKLAAPSNTAIPAGGDGDSWSSLKGQERMDAIWNQAMADIGDK